MTKRTYGNGKNIVKTSVNNLQKGKVVKILSAATLTSCVFIGAPAFANDTTYNTADNKSVDILDNTDLSTTTLEYLNENKALIPQVSNFDYPTNSFIEGDAVLAPNSGYSLSTPTETTNPDNIITKYEVKEVTRYYDKQTGELVVNPTQDGIDNGEYKVVNEKDLTPVLYEVKLEKTSYESKDYNADKLTKTNNYNWKKADGKVTFENGDTLDDKNSISYQYNYKNTYGEGNETLTVTTESLGDITVKYDTTNTLEYVWNLPNSEYNNADFNGTFYNLSHRGLGGAITNDSVLGNIIADFIDNETTSCGGGICNNAKTSLGNIKGNFVGNIADSYGGAIYNNGSSVIGNIDGSFIKNTAVNSEGGAICNYAEIGYINGDFIANSAKRDGGAIYNGSGGFIGNITGDFIDNISNGCGGAIFGYGNFSDITGNFINNQSSSGGAIYLNNQTNGKITGDFINNSAKGMGGAIVLYNSSSVESITGNFINNSAGDNGGALFLYGKVGNITGDFIGNYAAKNGGAIYAQNLTGANITGNFIGNHSEVYNGGGAIYSQYAKFGTIAGDFIGNYTAKSGGAIYNDSGSYIDKIIGDFIGNYGTSQGGAIINSSGTIGEITGNFISNHINGTGYIYGGAINSTSGAKAGNVTGSFINNYAESTTDYTAGGAIANYYSSKFNDITGNFINNHVKSVGPAMGGALYNNSSGTMGNIIGDFINNYAESTNSYAYGGAIDNTSGSKMGNITGVFINNHALGATNVYGGAIHIDSGSNILDVKSEFINNSAKSTSGTAQGGAIMSMYSGNIGNIIANFVGNSAEANTNAEGGAIFARYGSNIGNIDGAFISNYVKSTNGEANGGAIYGQYSGNFGNITGDFIANTAEAKLAAQGGALHLQYGAIVKDINGSFINNNVKSDSALAQGGAIYTLSSSIGNITGDFNGNSATSSADANGGAIALDNGAKIGNITGKFSNNTATADENVNGGAIYNSKSTISTIESEFTNNGAKAINGTAQGGAVYNSGGIGSADESGKTISFVNTSFYNNHADSDRGNAYGGAIYSLQDIGIKANKGRSEFSGNYTLSNGVKDSNAIHMAAYTTTETDAETGDTIYTLNTSRLSFVTEDDGTIVMNDKISGDITEGTSYKLVKNTETGLFDKEWINTTQKSYSVDIDGDSTGNFVLNNNIVGSPNVTLSNTNLHLGVRDNVLDGTNFTMNSGYLNMINNQIGVANLNSMSINGEVKTSADVNLKAETMDRLTAKSYTVSENAQLNVTRLNLLNDSDKNSVKILYAEKEFANVVKYTGENPIYSSAKNPIAYTPIYKYNLGYEIDENDERGYFTFSRGGNSVSADNFNPAVLTSPVAAESGATSTQNQVFNYSFQNADNFMKIPYLERVSKINANKYALSPTGDATDVGTFSPLFSQNEGNSVWVKPYASFESIPLKNGPKVNSTTYGTLVGYDTGLKEIRKGWTRTFTGYIGYNGASQHYIGISSTLNGGLIGGTLSLYKKNFFNATTLSTGSIVGENNNMYGHENFTMLMAGVGNKTGYNFEFKEGKYIIQPNLLLSYTFVNTFDYKNAAGVKIESDPLHAIQVAPGVRFIGNFKNGWQPYVGVNMVWNLMGKSHSKANGVELPEMSIKPYVQYGVGVQKSIKDHFMAYGQAMIQNGGRNGISLTAGFRWALGHNCKYDKVQKENKNLKVTKDKNPNSFANVVKDSLNVDNKAPNKTQDKAITTIKTTEPIKASEKPVEVTTSTVANTTPNTKVVPAATKMTSVAANQTTPARRMVIHTDESTITIHKAVIKGL